MKKILVLLIVILFFEIKSSEQTPGTTANNDVSKIESYNSYPYALLAGGSKGIGYAIAEALAKRHYNLILIARHRDSLAAAKNKLETTYNIHVEILVNDLAREEAATEIAKWCTERNIPLKMLCNIAGFGGARDYLRLPLDTVRYMVRLNVESVMTLTLTLLPLLEKKLPFLYFKCSEYGRVFSYPHKKWILIYKSRCYFF